VTRLAPILVAALLLATGCGGSSDTQTAAGLASKIGCPHASVQHKTQPNEPTRKDRVDCHGLTVVTFANGADRDGYVSTVKAAGQAFGEPMGSAVGDGWAVVGPRSKLDAVKSSLP
jgi:hypothetical protein